MIKPIEINDLKFYKLTTLILSLALFAVSLTQVAFIIDYKSTPTYSIVAFLSGWMDCFEFPYRTWLANPCIILSWIMIFKKTNTALLFSFLASCISISFLSATTITVNDVASGEIISYNIGYWLWFLSCFLFFLPTLGIYFLEQNKSIQ